MSTQAFQSTSSSNKIAVVDAPPHLKNKFVQPVKDSEGRSNGYKHTGDARFVMLTVGPVFHPTKRTAKAFMHKIR